MKFYFNIISLARLRNAICNKLPTHENNILPYFLFLKNLIYVLRVSLINVKVCEFDVEEIDEETGIAQKNILSINEVYRFYTVLLNRARMRSFDFFSYSIMDKYSSKEDEVSDEDLWNYEVCDGGRLTLDLSENILI